MRVSLCFPWDGMHLGHTYFFDSQSPDSMSSKIVRPTPSVMKVIGKIHQRLRGHRPRISQLSQFRFIPIKPIQPTVQRLIWVWGFLVVSSLGLLARLYHLQISLGAVWPTEPPTGQVPITETNLPRRPIVDRQGNVIAVDQTLYNLYAHPRQFRLPKSELIQRLSPLLRVPAQQLELRLNQGETGIKVSDSLSENVADQISNLQMDGLELTRRQQRLYPQQELFGEAVGYVNLDRKGQGGVELSQEELIVLPTHPIGGKPMPSSLSPMANGFQSPDLRLQLTLDGRLQKASRLVLQQQVRKFGAKRGTVIVMDVRDGAVRALVTEPSFNPNLYYQSNLSLLKNWAITDLFEPGSTFKPLNVAIALETNSIQPDTVLYDQGKLTIGKWPILNNDFAAVGPRGNQTITQILIHSSNVGMVNMMATVPRREFYHWLQTMGIGKPTGIDLPSESIGQLKSEAQFVNVGVESATAAFGQGLSMTPLQLAQLLAVIGNGGNLVVPHVVVGLVDVQGNIGWQPKYPTPRRIFSSHTTNTVLQMMTAVVNQGTGKASQIPGYSIAGKTGTAQKANSKGGYGNRTISSFGAILPANDPRFVVLTVIDEPMGDNAFGSTVSAPVVKAVMEVLIGLDGIPPQGLFTH